MSDAISGTFSDIRFVKSRKVAQITVEIPIEKAAEAIALFGAPNPAQEVWVALARLKSSPITSHPTTPICAETQNGQKEQTKWQKMRPSAQAAMRCHDEEFRSWLQDDCSGVWQAASRDAPDRLDRPAIAAEVVRRYCGVKSRAELDRSDSAAAAWSELQSAFQEFSGQQRAQQQHDAYAR